VRENGPKQRAQIEERVAHAPPNLPHVGPIFAGSFPPVFAGFGPMQQLHPGL